jgi:hypothetical protein
MRNRILCNILGVLLFCSFAGRVDAQPGWVKLVAGEQAKEGRITAIAADTYVIDIGVSRGARVGEHYLVHYDSGNVHDVNGVLLGVYKVPVAVLRVREVATWESFCEVAAPSRGWVIQRGDGVVSMAATHANKLKFATFRSTPGKPRSPGYNGRWTRVSAGIDPFNIVVKYNTYWTLPGLPQTRPPASPGFYYMILPTVPPFNIGVSKAPPVAPVVLPDPSLRVAQAPQAPVQSIPPPVHQAPAPPVPPVYQPFPTTMPAFDANQISDARLIRTFPLTQVEMYALEIQHRGAWSLYSNKRYLEAFSAFCKQSLDYAGNYLSAYWAGISALKLENPQVAFSWFNRALEINPHYLPAMKQLSDMANQMKEPSQPAEARAKAATKTKR